MVNAQMLAVTSASTPTVNAGSAGCKNCQGPSGTSETPSFASLLDAQTNEGAPLSDQPLLDNDLSAPLAAIPLPTPDSLPAAALLALAANDALPPIEQVSTDGLAPVSTKADPLPINPVAKPVDLEGESKGNPNPGAIIGQINPAGENITAAPSSANAGSVGDKTVPALTSPQAPAVTPLAQDNQVAPATPQNRPPEALLNPAAPQNRPSEALLTPADKQIPIPAPAVAALESNSVLTALTGTAAATNSVNQAGLPVSDAAAFATGAGTASDPVPVNGQSQPSNETPLILNDNTSAKAPASNPLAGQQDAKTELTTDEALLARQALAADVKSAGNGATQTIVEEAPSRQQSGLPAQTSAADIAALNNGSAGKKPLFASPPGADTLAPVKIDRDAPVTQTTTTAPETSAAPEGQARPASLMERLKPLTQAAFSFQGAQNAQNSTKTLDGVTSAMSMTATGELARPTGISGLSPTSNNPALPQVPLNNIAVHIASQASAGNQRFNIRLDPPELGRIDIRLEIGRDGQTLTHLAVEKPETLDLLRQDHRALERALNNAGLDSRNGSLSFSLRDEKQDGQQTKNTQGDETATPDDKLIEQDDAEPVITRTLNMSTGIDISI